MTRWDAYWFGPVAAVRPYLFYRIFLILLALDVWLLRLPRGARFSAGGFEVAHFGWIDALQPTPTPTLFVATTLLVGLLALVSALVGPRRSLLVVLFTLYSYSWMMSQADSYQHHYLLSLVLLALIFFPRTTGWNDQVAAWAFVLVGVTFAVVYFWTAVAKVDGQWLGGHTIRRVAEYYAPGADGIVPWVGRAGLWPWIAAGAIVVELLLSAAYLLSPRQDRGGGSLVAWSFGIAWLFAVLLHVGIESLGLHIGWFSYYMLAAASVFFLPQRFLVGLTTRVAAPIRRLTDFARERRSGSGPSTAAILAAALIVGTGLIVLGQRADLPGSLVACALAASALLAFTVTMSVRGNPSVGRCAVLATALATLVMTPLVANDTVRFRFYSSAGRNHQLLGNPTDAVGSYLRAVRHASPTEPDLAGLYHNLGSALERLDQADEAADAYRESLKIDPALGPAHLRLATLLRARGSGDEAIGHYRRGLDARPDDAQAHYDLAMLLIPRGALDEAVSHLREVLRVRPDWAPAMSNLALLLVVHPSQGARNPGEATRLAEGAARVTQFRDAAVLGSLAEVYARTGQSDRAVATLRQAIEIATANGNEGLVERLLRQLDGYE